ncbi:MAG TPA: osmotically-inducible protein OsmY [Pasteurellaceae bacterium]|nr:osmotically-inducible protein OsmY [Pasteurellaceae bacterium]
MNINSIKKLSLIFASALLLQGCVAALIGGGAVATKVGTDPRTMGTQVDDETMEFRVFSAINKDAQIKEEGRVSVVAYSGRVLLIGQVPNESLKEVASNLAKGAEGVTHVYNEIRVGQPISLWQQTKDSGITATIKSKLLVNNQVKTTAVKAITENNEVFLMGNVTAEQGNAASEVARNVAGVTKVVKVFNYIN